MNRLPHPAQRHLTCAVLFALLFSLLPFFASVSHAQDEPDPQPAPAVVEENAQPLEAEADPIANDEDVAPTLAQRFDAQLSAINETLFGLLFFDAAFGALKSPVIDEETGQPVLDAAGNPVVDGPELRFLVIFLLIGAILFTFIYGFITFRAFGHAFQVLRGKYDKKEDEGEVSHFRALTSAMSATVGLGNIAGVAIAINLGGPGAVFWMLVTALFGMASKFSSCTLAMLYRKVNVDGTISGGPMYYLDQGLAEKGGLWKPIGKILAVVFAIFIMGAAIGGGNMFQANQSFEVVNYVAGMANPEWAAPVFGIVLMFFVGLVIIGGIKRIGAATSRIVPFMAVLYVLGCLIVILGNLNQIPAAFQMIFRTAFTPEAGMGGLVGVLIIGIQRAAFSSEAGLGSAAIAHAAARTKEPVREGIVGMVEPFFDTVIICTMTALVVIVTGTYAMQQEEIDILMGGAGVQPGAALTAHAFSQVISWFPYVLAAAVVLFAYSTMISWCYYGERGWIYLADHVEEGMGVRTVIGFRIIFLLAIFVGAVAPLGSVLDLADVLLLSLAFPNILGSLLLAPKVIPKVKDYMRRLRAGEMEPDR